MKIIYYMKKVWEKTRNLIEIKRNHIKYQSYPDIRGHIWIYNKGSIELGKSVKINSGKFPNPVGGALGTMIAVDPNARLVIGDRVGISNAEIVVKQQVIIGEDVMLGGGVKIYDSDFHPINIMNRIKKPNEGISKPVEIKKGAFIGAYSILLKGITIGENSVVGAGSVVTKSIPKNEIWAGNPAKYIGEVKS